MLKSKEIRQKFIDYFKKNGHVHVSSSSLVPVNDPTLLFTNAGMVQFKDMFLGLQELPYKRAVTSQKCVRAGGKHNDLDSVGRTPRHHTFFEMLGNFSFGDYFKRDAIHFAWEFLTGELGLPKEELYISVYLDDDEAFNLWQEVAKVPADRIVRLGEKDNFWSMGDTGPCGPCSEIYIDRGFEMSCGREDCTLGVCDCDRFTELWNLVFMQFDRDSSGKLTPLPKPSIDTGMGLERITMILQGVKSNYDTDLLFPIIQEVEKLTGKNYYQDQRGFPFRVIADHTRACSFLISDGVMPSNEGRGYVLRRILRRAVRFGRVIGFSGPFLYKMVDVVVKIMGETYGDLVEKSGFIKEVIRNEEERFLLTLSDGIQRVEEIINRAKEKGINTIDGKDAFLLYDTFGFPIDLTQDIAEENNLELDRKGFEEAMTEQRERAKKARAKASYQGEGLEKELESIPPTEFLGYQENLTKGKVIAVTDKGIIVDKTVFYGESGGQVGDKGYIRWDGGAFNVIDTKVVNKVYVHIGKGSIPSVGEIVELNIDVKKRKNTARNHTATHLLHQALRVVLGTHVNQKGSYVEDERLRFDFSHYAPVTKDEIERIETIVNDKILENLKIESEITTVEDAIEKGAAALFGEKYGQEVRMITVDSYSKELCGGTHVSFTGEIGLFKITGESSIGAGLRRIEAVTGTSVLELLKTKENTIEEVSHRLKTSKDEVIPKIEELQASIKQKDKELEDFKNQMVASQYESLVINAKKGDGYSYIVSEVQVKDMDSLRELADRIRNRLGDSIVILGSVIDEKASFVVMVSKDLTKQYHAGKLIKDIAAVAGGSGGGRPDMAMAGGRFADKLQDALNLAKDLLK
jgi:alanyl-tRNA synthetase